MAKSLRLFVAGFGVVGQALAARLIARREELKLKDGLDIKVVGIADSRSSVVVAEDQSDRGLDLYKVLLAKRWTGAVGTPSNKAAPEVRDLLGSTHADALVELAPAGGPDGEPGLSHISAALDQGIHVVTANKMPLALKYAQLVTRARRRGLAFRYGACVGGGVPVLEFGDACNRSDTVTKIDGVLNATSNFILTSMEGESSSFRHALLAARRAGYAEVDPSSDIDGVDAACKIVILVNHLFRKTFTLADVGHREGIRHITRQAVQEAKRRGRRIRMIAAYGRGRRPSVRILEISDRDPLSLDGPNNAVRFTCKDSGDRIASGRAGGGEAASSAVLRDIFWIEKEKKMMML